jgi:hypothetical protein
MKDDARVTNRIEPPRLKYIFVYHGEIFHSRNVGWGPAGWMWALLQHGMAKLDLMPSTFSDQSPLACSPDTERINRLHMGALNPIITADTEGNPIAGMTAVRFTRRATSAPIRGHLRFKNGLARWLFALPQSNTGMIAFDFRKE